jgi:hypothetical protein
MVASIRIRYQNANIHILRIRLFYIGKYDWNGTTAGYYTGGKRKSLDCDSMCGYYGSRRIGWYLGTAEETMKIIVKGEVDRVDSEKEVFAIAARKELEEEYKGREHILAGGEVEAIGGGKFKPIERMQDIPQLRRDMEKYKKNYERGMPIKLSGRAKNELWKKAKRLKDEFVIGMVPQREMHPVRTTVVAKNTRSWNCKKGEFGGVVGSSAATAVVCDYNKLRDTKAIERNTAWLQRNQPKINEFKRIMRILEPNNPNIANIERFRPQ